MIEIIKQLLELAEEDGIIRQLRLDYEEIPAKIHQLESKVNGAQQNLDECTSRVLAVEDRKKQAEEELEEIRTNIAKSNSKRSLVKTNREYWASMKEVEDLKAQLKTKEEDVLSVLEELESLGSEKVAFAEALEAIRPDFETEISDLKQKLEVAQAEIDKRQETRGKLTKKVDRDLLERYEALTNSRGGLALAGRSRRHMYGLQHAHSAPSLQRTPAERSVADLSQLPAYHLLAGSRRTGRNFGAIAHRSSRFRMISAGMTRVSVRFFCTWMTFEAACCPSETNGPECFVSE